MPQESDNLKKGLGRAKIEKIIKLKPIEPAEKKVPTKKEGNEKGRLEKGNIKNAKNLEELLSVVRSSNGLVVSAKMHNNEYQEETLSAEELEDLILKVMSGDVDLNYVTRKEGLREKVKELLYKKLADEGNDPNIKITISSVYIRGEYTTIKTQRIPKFPELERINYGNGVWKIITGEELKKLYKESADFEKAKLNTEEALNKNMNASPKIEIPEGVIPVEKIDGKKLSDSEFNKKLEEHHKKWEPDLAPIDDEKNLQTVLRAIKEEEEKEVKRIATERAEKLAQLKKDFEDLIKMSEENKAEIERLKKAVEAEKSLKKSKRKYNNKL